MQKEAEFGIKLFVMNQILYDWKEEVNTSGAAFDFDSQDIYRAGYDKLLTKRTLVEAYPNAELSAERKGLLDQLLETAKSIIVVYETHRTQFDQYPREKLMINTFRRQNESYGSVADDKLLLMLYSNVELLSKKEYYASSFFKEYGFLLENYHYQIYLFCQYLAEQIDENILSKEEYLNCFDLATKFEPFDMELVGAIYKACNGAYFTEIAALDFYLNVNLMKTTPNLQIRESELKRAYYIIHGLSNQIKDECLRKWWLQMLLLRLGRTGKNYRSKYREVCSQNATAADSEFVEKIDAIFKRFRSV